VSEEVLDHLRDLGLETGEWVPDQGLVKPFASAHYAYQKDRINFELLITTASREPNAGSVRELWKARQQKQANGLLLIVTSPKTDGEVVICGPAEVDLSVRKLPQDQLLGLIGEAIREPSAEASIKFLRDRLRTTEEDVIPGITNEALFADHTLVARAREHKEWDEAIDEAQQIADLEGTALVEALGYSIDDSSGNDPLGLKVLRESDGNARAIGVFLDRDESYDASGGRFLDQPPSALAIERARKENLPYVLITRGSEIRLHPTGDRVGVGRKDAISTFIQADMAQLSADDAAFVPLLFSARALVDGGAFDEVLDWSRDFSADLSERLRERVYELVVPQLAVAVAEAGGSKDEDLAVVYEQAMLILFRLLFVAYSEDRDLLPYRSNGAYHENSLKSIARELADRTEDFAGDKATDLWTRVGSLWEAIDGGNKGWGIPAYGGGLFDSETGEAAAAVAKLDLTNEAFGPPLKALLTDSASGELGPVDFRSLAVRDFGTIYEGLLESNVSRAPSDLTVDKKARYVPAKKDDEVVVSAGEVYSHNRSGERKSSGSYFTPSFVVEYLLDHSLEPALDQHLERVAELVEAGDEEAASAKLFDFRCADLAMGSGHFLVAASDRIEARFTEFLREHPLEGVNKELTLLRTAAHKSLGEMAEMYEIDDRMLLRRLVARRCVYGVDLNRIAVELSRLALWIHTFVPGLPLSFLDHTLVHGDALTGIGTVAEVEEYLRTHDQSEGSNQVSLNTGTISQWLREATEPLLRLANAADTTRSDLEQAKEDQEEAMQKVAPVKDLFDIVCAHRRGELDRLFDAGVSNESVASHPGLATARAEGHLLDALHFPVAFPEVFIREDDGFDCLIGNPPWDKVEIESDVFWSSHFPGMRSMTVAEMNAEIARHSAERPDLVEQFEQERRRAEELRSTLLKGPFPGFGAHKQDLYQAFAWRFWSLASPSGRIGVVLPRTALAGAGSQEWREAVLTDGAFSNVLTVTNKNKWVFEGIHGQYTVGLVSLARLGAGEEGVSLAGHATSLEELDQLRNAKAVPVSTEEFRSWSKSLEFPTFPLPQSVKIFEKLRRSPRLDSGIEGVTFKPVGEFNATNDKHRFLLDPEKAEGLWPVYGGKSIDIWEPDRGDYYAWADPESIVSDLMDKRRNQARTSSSAFYETSGEVLDDPETLPCQKPRIAYRWTTNRTNRRTVISSLIPPHCLTQNGIPYLLTDIGSEKQEAFVIGTLSSIPCDWFARCLVELNLYFYTFDSLPMPIYGGQHTDELVLAAGRLAAIDDRFADWAKSVGVECGPLDEEEKKALITRLDALVAAAYGLHRDDLIHVFETFHVGWDYQERLDRTLEEFDSL
jgi:hypothetical protein